MYHFLQNPVLNANKFFSNKAGLPKAVIRQNRWGINGSGPVYIPKLFNGRNRTFWMYGYEGIHDADPRGTITTAVPTSAQKNGDFSSLLALGSQYQIYDPATIRPAEGGRFSRQPLAGNIIPSSRINPVARKIADLWDPPNQPGTIDGRDNWTTPGPEWDKYYNHVFRIDHNLSDKQRFFVRGNLQRPPPAVRHPVQQRGWQQLLPQEPRPGRRSRVHLHSAVSAEYALQLHSFRRRR